MVGKYSRENIDQFFEDFKSLEPSYSLENVEDLLSQENVQPQIKIKSSMSISKYLIGLVTLIVITNIALILTDNSPNNNQTTIIENDEEKQAEWPADSVIDGESFILSLTDEELQKIGFLVDETGIYYHNQYSDQVVCFHSRFSQNPSGAWGGEITRVFDKLSRFNKKTQPSGFDFYPIVTSSNSLEVDRVDKATFAQMNDSLVAIRLSASQLKYGDNDKIIWFKYSNSLFDHLPERYSYMRPLYLELVEIKRKTPDRDLVQFGKEQITKGIKKIDLSKDELEKIGLRIENDTLRFAAIRGKTFKLDFVFYKGSNHLSHLKYEEGTENELHKISYITDEYGEKYLSIRRDKEDEDKSVHETFVEDMPFLIPVIIRQEDYPETLDKSIIFWFLPDETLFEKLPPELGDVLRKEYSRAKKQTEEKSGSFESPCAYFEACQSVQHVSDFVTYPTVTKGETNVKFRSTTAFNGTLALVNVSGTSIKMIEEEKLFSPGTYDYNVDLSNVPPGIYLVVLKTTEGILSERVLVGY